MWQQTLAIFEQRMFRNRDQLTRLEDNFAQCIIFYTKQRPALQHEDVGSYLDNYNSKEDLLKKLEACKAMKKLPRKEILMGAQVAVVNKCALLITCSGSCKDVAADSGDYLMVYVQNW